MAKKAQEPNTTAARESELEAQIRALETLASDAEGANQYAPAVAAKGKALGLRRELAQLRAEQEGAAITDPVQRLEHMRQRAAAEGSWVAAASLQKQVDEARAKQDAERKRLEEKARKDPKRLVTKLQETLRMLPDSLRSEVLAPFGRR